MPEGADDLIASLPTRVPRAEAAALVTRYFFRVSPRTLERWPVAWRRLNGRAHADVIDLFAVAAAMVGKSCAIRGDDGGTRAV